MNQNTNFISIHRIHARITNLTKEIEVKAEQIKSQADIHEIELLHTELTTLQWVLRDNFANTCAFESRVIALICDGEGLPYTIVTTKTRRRHVVQTRQMIAYFLRQFTDLTLWEISMAIGKHQDHATVTHCIHTVRDVASVDIDFRAKIEKYRNEITRIYNEINGNPLTLSDY